MDRISEYAILRLVPEAFRGEQINIGVVVFGDTFLDVRISIQPALLKAMVVDPAKLEWMSSYLREQDDPSLPISERWERLAEVPGLLLSERGWLAADGDEQYEARLDRIRSDYVDRPKRPTKLKRGTSLTRELKGIFRDYRIMGKTSDDVSHHKVVANVPVGPAGRLHVDFVVKNGIYHATETADFRSVEDVGISELKEAALAAVTLQCAREQLGPKHTKCYLVYSASSFVETAIGPALQVAERGVDRMFNIDSGDQRRDYFDIMLSAAGSPSLFDKN